MANLVLPVKELIWVAVLIAGLCGISVTADTRSIAESPGTDAPEETPAHWRVVGNARASYTLRAEQAAVLSGKRSARLIARADADPFKFGAIMQSSSSAHYRGKRVEFSAYIASDNAPAGASIWLRADDEVGDVVAFENTYPRGIRGTEDWTYQAIVMDIPETATALHYGAVLSGQGTLYADDLQLRIVDSSVPITAKPIALKSPFTTQTSEAMQLPAEPRNLDFEDVLLASFHQ